MTWLFPELDLDPEWELEWELEFDNIRKVMKDRMESTCFLFEYLLTWNVFFKYFQEFSFPQNTICSFIRMSFDPRVYQLHFCQANLHLNIQNQYSATPISWYSCLSVLGFWPEKADWGWILNTGLVMIIFWVRWLSQGAQDGRETVLNLQY